MAVIKLYFEDHSVHFST